jgi:crotonobetainyl-CoA:carnitine CoA-transferase CaiB-like acyl-CoA transferase
MTAARLALERTWHALGGPTDALGDVEVHEHSPVLPSTYPLDDAAAAAIGVSSMAANEVWAARTGARQRVDLDVRHAAVAFCAERFVRVNGEAPGELWSPYSGIYPTADDRFVQLHVNFPHHLERTLDVLGVVADRDAIAAACARWSAAALEEAVAEAGGCAAMGRTRAEWLAHPQSGAVLDLELLETDRLTDPNANAWSRAERPLAGLRVLDLTRVLAGPTCARTLGAHGATVTRVIGPHLPENEAALPETSLGKTTVELDLRDRADNAALRALVAETDVFVQSYRPGALDHFGFGPYDVAALSPGIVYVSLSAYSRQGPWAARRGYDSIVQMATGIAVEEGAAVGQGRPRHVAASALDYATGYLAAAAAMLALVRDGAAYHVQCSLAQTREWLERLGRIPLADISRPEPGDVTDLMTTTGNVAHIRPAALLRDTPQHWNAR